MPGQFLLVCVFFWNDFSHNKIINHIRLLFSTAISICPPPHKSTMISPVVRVKEGMEIKNQTKTKKPGGVCCKVQGWRVGEYHKGGKKQEDEERGSGMCPECGGEEEVTCTVLRWAEEIYRFFLACVFKFKRGG